MAAIDGVELFAGTKKFCGTCLKRKNKAGQTQSFHRSVVCATARDNPHLILGEEMLYLRDGAEKAEGELTGGKRLTGRLHERHGRFADVIVADALYLNAPFINTVLVSGMDVAIGMKDEKKGSVPKRKRPFCYRGRAGEGIPEGKRRIEGWDIKGFEMEWVIPQSVW